jgi:hypothetical protein
MKLHRDLLRIHDKAEEDKKMTALNKGITALKFYKKSCRISVLQEVELGIANQKLHWQLRISCLKNLKHIQM